MPITLSILVFKMKNILKRITEIVVFLILLIFLFAKISLLCVSFGKGLENDRNERLFFELPDNTVDILFTGDSHIHNSFIPQMIFDEAGYTSAIMATSSQSIIDTYWIIKETMEHQNLKIIVIDSHSLECASRREEDYLHFVSGVLAMPDACINKYKCFYDLKHCGVGIGPTLTIEDAVGFLKYRQDFERSKATLSELINLLFCPVKEFETFGYNAKTQITSFDEATEIIEYDEKTPFSSTVTFEFFEKIVDLCKENDIELVVTRTPFTLSSANKITYDYIFNYAEDNDIYVVDYFTLLDELNISFKTDFFDHSHVNYNGAKKITSYIISFFQEQFSLEDHRLDQKYNLWNNNGFDYNILEEEMNENIERLEE